MEREKKRKRKRKPTSKCHFVQSKENGFPLGLHQERKVAPPLEGQGPSPFLEDKVRETETEGWWGEEERDREGGRERERPAPRHLQTQKPFTDKCHFAA